MIVVIIIEVILLLEILIKHKNQLPVVNCVKHTASGKVGLRRNVRFRPQRVARVAS